MFVQIGVNGRIPVIVPLGDEFRGTAGSTERFLWCQSTIEDSSLKLLQRAGKITDLRLQVPFLLIPSQYENGKCIERECKYIADFTYRENGKFVVEDAKGLKTDVYIIKRKLMLEKYGIKIRET
jgi:hypothetical protein